mgnify:CR=1 FL=1
MNTNAVTSPRLFGRFLTGVLILKRKMDVIKTGNVLVGNVIPISVYKV